MSYPSSAGDVRTKVLRQGRSKLRAIVRRDSRSRDRHARRHDLRQKAQKWTLF